MGPMHPPESLHCHVLGRSGIAHDAQNPTVDGALMQSEERFEGIQVALPKLVEDAASLVLHLRCPSLYPYVRYS
jgi:hypothetical protein